MYWKTRYSFGKMQGKGGKNYSLKASSTMAKSENLVKNHVQLQNVSDMSIHPFPQPLSLLPVQRGCGTCDQTCLLFSVLCRFFLKSCCIFVCVHSTAKKKEKLIISSGQNYYIRKRNRLNSAKD